MSDSKSPRKNALGRGLGALLEDSPAKGKAQEILPEVRKCRLMVEDFTNLVRSGQHVGVTGKPSNIDSITAYLKEMLELLYNKIQFNLLKFFY